MASFMNTPYSSLNSCRHYFHHLPLIVSLLLHFSKYLLLDNHCKSSCKQPLLSYMRIAQFCKDQMYYTHISPYSGPHLERRAMLSGIPTCASTVFSSSLLQPYRVGIPCWEISFHCIIPHHGLPCQYYKFSIKDSFVGGKDCKGKTVFVALDVFVTRM